MGRGRDPRQQGGKGSCAARVLRRALLLLPAQLTAVRLSQAGESGGENLECRGGRLYWPGGSAIAAVGRSGVRANKHEGDGATPAGTYPLVSVLYRPDRVDPPR